jgi:hypothetical protein
MNTSPLSEVLPFNKIKRPNILKITIKISTVTLVLDNYNVLLEKIMTAKQLNNKILVILETVPLQTFRIDGEFLLLSQKLALFPLHSFWKRLLF